MRERWVIDASVAAKWYLLDEDGTDKATRILSSFLVGELDLVAPDIIFPEMGHAIRSAVARGRVSPMEATEAIAQFGRLGLTTVASRELLVDAMSVGITFGCSFYDALYLALAEILGLRLVLADDRLHGRLAGRVDCLLRLDDFDMEHP